MTDSGPQTPPDLHAQPPTPSSPPANAFIDQGPNVAVVLGGLLILISFFLPWIYLGTAQVSGFDLVLHADSAQALLKSFGRVAASPNAVTRPLLVVPLLGLSILFLNVSAGKRPFIRIFSRILILCTGALLAFMFGSLGAAVVQLRPAPGLWTTFSGGLLVVLGSLFDLLYGR